MRTRLLASAAAMGLLFTALGSTFGQLAATATIFSAPNGPNFNYTVQLTNNGGSNIGTFWFAWTPPGMPVEYDFLPSSPTVTGQPVGWVGPVSSNGFPGFSIEYYNLSGSAVAPGQMATFTFTSSDSPAVLQGSTFGFPNTTSFIYAGSPEVGATARVNPVFIPEPASVTCLLTAIACATAARPRRPNRFG